jgi:hypothetical protein
MLTETHPTTERNVDRSRIAAGAAAQVAELEPTPACQDSLLAVLRRAGEPRIYVHDCVESEYLTFTRRLGAAAHLLSERALLMALPGDLVLVTSPVDDAYLAYLDGLELGPGREGVLALVEPRQHIEGDTLMTRLAHSQAALGAVADRLRMARAIRLNPYIGTASASLARQRLAEIVRRDVTLEAGSVGSVALANRKDRIRAIAIELGIPVANGATLTLPVGTQRRAVALRRAIGTVLESGSGAIVRAAVSSSGADLLVIHDAAGIEAAIDWLAERPWVGVTLVEELVPFHSSPNVGAWIEDDGSVRITGIAAQRLNPALSHFGNESGSGAGLSDMIDSTRRLAERLGERGFRGPLGMDFIVPSDAGRPGHLLAEVNGRINGATYGLAAYQRLNEARRLRGRAPLASWISTKMVELAPCGFETLQRLLADILLGPASTAGVMPYGVGWLPHGLCNFMMFAETRSAAGDLEDELISRLHRGR